MHKLYQILLKKKMIVKALSLVMAMTVVFSLCMSVSVSAYDFYNETTSYEVAIQDHGSTISDEEDYKELVAYMTPLTMYGNVLFYSDDFANADAESKAKEVLDNNLFAENSTDDVIMLLYDTNRHAIYLQIFGAFESVYGDREQDIVNDALSSLADDKITVLDYYEAVLIRANMVFSDISEQEALSMVEDAKNGVGNFESSTELDITWDGVSDLIADELLSSEEEPLFGDEDPYGMDESDGYDRVYRGESYQAIINDQAKLLRGEEIDLLLEDMKPILAYGNVAYVSVNENHMTTEYCAEQWYRNLFGTDSGTLFLIDMDNREIFIFNDGAIYRTINKGYAYSITDNVYRYASASDYYKCVSKAFEQELKLLKGQRISQPMKYICNTLLAIILALLFNYFIVKLFSNARKPSDHELLSGVFVQQNLTNVDAEFTHHTRIYSPQSKSSGGSHGGGHGGGHSGGGGGHRF